MKRLSLIAMVIFFLMAYVPWSFAGDITGKVRAKRIKSPEGIVVYIEEVKGDFEPPEELTIIEQVDLVFVPRISPVLVGTKVGFNNRDTVLHNIFGVGDDDFDLGTWKGDSIREHTFRELGEIALLCNVHPEMEAYVFVLQNPFFTQTDKEGRYVIKDVPSGKYKLKIWHDGLKSKSREVVVTASPINVDF